MQVALHTASLGYGTRVATLHSSAQFRAEIVLEAKLAN